MAFDRASVKGLPEGANVQVIKDVPYVYFRYQWKDATGKVKYARDYLGTVENGQFIPNDYYLRLRPTKDKRPEERWSAKQRKEMAVSAISFEDQNTSEEKQVVSGADIQTKSVGVTALVASILDQNGMIEDALEMFGGDLVTTTRLLNIAIRAAITAKLTYLSADESKVQMFLGNQTCPTSPRASELHQKIGEKLDLSARISKRRIARLRDQPMLALDGSRIDCNSDNILDTVIGRRKNGSYASQINFSLLVDASSGSPVGYRYFSGNTNDVSTLEDFTNIWNAYGLVDKDPMIVVDRGYYSQESLIKLGNQDYRSLAGAKTGYKLVKSITEECFFMGYFAFASNAKAELEESLDSYKLRNEAEVVFKLMLGNLLRTTRVHSSQALEGLLFTTFVALSILTNLRVRMKADLNGQPISSSYTIAEVFARLKKIQLIELEGKKYLINVSAKDKKLVEALGFAGLYDSTDAVLNALTKFK